MNLLTSFCKTTGIKPEKANIYEKLFPLPFNDFIILNTQTEDQNSNYVFWDRVVELISPKLKEAKIEVIQFVKDKTYNHDHIFVKENVSLNEKTYLIKKCKFFCGSSNLYSLICSENKIPQCFLKHNYEFNNNLAEECEVIHGESKRKGFLNPIGNNVNNIRPEEVALRILKSLFPTETFEYFDNSIYIGKVYAIRSIDLIPDCFFQTSKKNFKDEIIVRMDEFFSEENLEKQLQICPCSIVSDKPISSSLLTKYKSRIKKVFFKIKQDSDPSMLQVLEELRITFDLMSSLSEKDLNEEKIKYLDYHKINKLNKVNLDCFQDLDKSKIKFKTNKIIIKSGRMYPSRSFINNSKGYKKVRETYFPLPEDITDSFREEADSFYFLTSEQI